VQHIHPHRGLELRQRGLHLPAQAVEFGEVSDTVYIGIDQCRYEGNLAGPEARRADGIPDLSELQRLWQGRQCLPSEP
jgi:hypothetical protein